MKDAVENRKELKITLRKYFKGGNLSLIEELLDDGYDVKPLCNLEFDWYQLKEIRLGLIAGLDVKSYANPKYSWEQMEKMREELLKDFQSIDDRMDDIESAFDEYYHNLGIGR